MTVTTSLSLPPPDAHARRGATGTGVLGPPPLPESALGPGQQVGKARGPGDRAGSRFRRDIEGLRALAVLLVLAYHADLGPFSGGYIGVDVFFVLSGFLITSLLVRELGVTGGLSLRRFWARRARRLLPASCLVIVATLVVGSFVLAPLAQLDLARDGLAAATFVVNIVFAHQQGDYLTADLAPSPLLHFWSLAVEEQFYLVWPILLLLVAGYRRRYRAAVAGLVAVLWPLSLAACVWLTTRNQPWAFYGLPTRAWELLTGAGLALLAGKILRIPGPIRALLGWAGLVAVVVSAIVYSDTTTFPGVAAALPVLATAAVVAAGPTLRTGPAALLRLGTAPVDRSALLQHLPVALARPRAGRGPAGPVERMAAPGRRAGLGRRGGRDLQLPREPCPALPMARRQGPARAGAGRQPRRHRRGDRAGRGGRHAIAGRQWHGGATRGDPELPPACPSPPRAARRAAARRTTKRRRRRRARSSHPHPPAPRPPRRPTRRPRRPRHRRPRHRRPRHPRPCPAPCSWLRPTPASWPRAC